MKTIGLWLLTMVIVSGCSKDELYRSFYSMGAENQCIRDNQRHPNESAKNLECMSNGDEVTKSYDDYKRQRQDTLGSTRGADDTTN